MLICVQTQFAVAIFRNTLRYVDVMTTNCNNFKKTRTLKTAGKVNIKNKSIERL